MEGDKRIRPKPGIVRKMAVLLMLLLGTSGCKTESPELQAEEQRLQERMEQLNQLKESIKELPRLQARVMQLEAENKKLRARLGKKAR